MPELPSRPPKKPQRTTPPPPDDASRRRLPLVVLGLVAVMLITMRTLSGVGSQDHIRYDELIRFVREGRVDWVEFRGAEIRGGYVKDKKPAPRTRAQTASAKGESGADTSGETGPGPNDPEKGGQVEESTPKTRPDIFVTGRVEDDSLVPLLEAHKVAFRAVPDTSADWPWMLYLGMTIFFMFFIWNRVFRGMGGQASGAFAFGKSRGKVFQEDDVDVTFRDVAGVEEAKEELQEIIEFLQRPEKYRAIGAKIPKGVLLVGPPGTGKTLLARAVAGEAKVPFISISGSEFVEMFVGVGAARVRDLFEQAAKSAPCIVFIDELDALGRARSGGGMVGSNEEREQTLNQLLVEMDGFEPHSAVIIMGATNRPEILDHALMRPGRFDRQVLVDRPDKEGREQILRVHVRAVKLAEDVDLSVIASQTPGFAGAEIANLVNEAALLAARRARTDVSMQEFSDAIDRVVAGLEKKNRLIGEEEKRRVAYHEVGHALSTALGGGNDAIHKISIVPRGMAALGYTMQLPTEERYLMTEREIRAKLVGLLGGRAAEEVVFGEASTGAQNDLQKATDIARAMVIDYGMSDKVGLVSLSRERKPVFLGGGEGGMAFSRDMGQRMADTIDEEVRRIVHESHQEALGILRRNRASLEHITGRLLEAEVLEGENLQQLIDDAKRQKVVEGNDGGA